MSLTRIDQDHSSDDDNRNNSSSSRSGSSIRKSSLLVNLSTVKKRSSVTTYLASSCSTLASRSKQATETTCYSPTSAPIITNSDQMRQHHHHHQQQQQADAGGGGDGDGGRVISGDGVNHHVLVCPQSAPPTLNGGPSYCLSNSRGSISSNNNNNNNNDSSDLAIRVEKHHRSGSIMFSDNDDDEHQHASTWQQITNQQQQRQHKSSSLQVDEITGGCKETNSTRRGDLDSETSRRNSKEDYSPEPIVEVKHTSSSSGSSAGSSSSGEHSSDNNNNNNYDEQDSSTKLIRRRTVRRYHRAALIDEPPGTTTSGLNSNAIELTVSINNNPEADSRGQFRTRQIGGYCNQQIKQQQQQQQQQQTKTKTCSSSSSSSSLTSSASKLAKCSVTTNRKSTTSHHRQEHLISSKSSSSSSKASSSSSSSSKTNLHDTSNKSTSSTLTSGSQSAATTVTSSTNTSHIHRGASPAAEMSSTPILTTIGQSAEAKSQSQRLLELRLNNQFKADLLDDDKMNTTSRTNNNNDLQLTGTTNSAGSRNSIEVNSRKQEESSSVHHSSSRQSFSSTSTSMRAGSLRKAAISSSSSVAASEEAEAALVSRSHSKLGGLISTSNLSTSSSSHRHFKSSAHSLLSGTLDTTGEIPLSLSSSSRDPATVFLDSESLFASPDVRSLVKEIGTDFAELENALSSTSALGSFKNNRTGGSASLSSRLFGNGQVNSRRPLSPLGGQYPAIKAAQSNDEEPITMMTTGGSKLSSSADPVRRPDQQSGGGSRCSTITTTDIELPLKFNRNRSNLSTASESSSQDRCSPSSRPNQSERIRELMSQAQSHVDRYGISSGQAPQTSTNQQSSEVDLKSPTFKSRSYQQLAASSSTRSELTPDAAGQRHRQEVEVDRAVEGAAKLHQSHCKAVMTESIERIDQRMSDLCKKFSECRDTGEAIDLLKIMIQMIEKAWSVPVCGDDLGFKLCNSLREAGGLDIILGFIQDSDISRKQASLVASASQAANTSYLPPVLFNNDNNCNEPTNQAIELGKVKDDATKASGKIMLHQESNLQAKNKSSSIPLRLNLSKLNQTSEVSAQSLDPPTATGANNQTPVDSVSQVSNETNNKLPTTTTTTTTSTAAKDSDSEIITSDLGLDSTSIESLSYVTPPSDDRKSPDLQEDFQAPRYRREYSMRRAKDESKDCATSVEPTATVEVPTTSGDNMSHESGVAREEAEEAEVQAEAEEDEAKTSLMMDELVYLSARLLSQCLTSDNRNYIVQNGLDQVIRLACNLITLKNSQSKRLLSSCSMQHQQTKGTSPSRKTSKNLAIHTTVAQQQQDPPQPEATVNTHVKGQAAENSMTEQTDTQVTMNKQQQPLNDYSDMHAIIGTEILQHLFKHSEDTCARLISLGGLEAILYGCRSSSIETLRHCASALANLALYGGPEGQQRMIEQKAHVWLFPLAFNEDDNIQYYACLAIVVLVANQEIEADVLKSSTLDLVEPFVTSHEPQKFAESTTSHIHGQSASWLRKLIPLLESKREEARNLACFHFAMEAYIKKEQGQTQVFKEIGAVEPLRKVGSSPLAIASKFACQALRLIGEKEPHKLSQQVPLWTSEDVSEWVSQIGFERFRAAFVDSRVDGDLLLQLDEDMLRTDIGIENGIIRRRFLRELASLKRIADYSAVDKTGLSSLLGSTGTHDFVQYIYPMVQLGVTRDNIHLLDSEQLLRECKVANTIHRMKLAHAIKELQEKMAVAAASSECCSNDGSEKKTLDVFMSYRRSTGSQLASLLKVFLELRNFSVFIDVDRLEAGKFDNNLLDSIKTAKNFILILSPNALDRCIGDHECKDWVHKEIVAALASNCNIIPIIDNFHWPDPEQLPEDMRSITYFNGVRWIHDYQDACVDKVERFIRGELNNGAPLGAGPQSIQSTQSSSLQRLACGGSTYSSTPSIVATPSIVHGGGGGCGFPSGSTSAYSSRAPFDTDLHPLSFANQYLHSAQQGGTSSGGRRCQP